MAVKLRTGLICEPSWLRIWKYPLTATICSDMHTNTHFRKKTFALCVYSVYPTVCCRRKSVFCFPERRSYKTDKSHYYTIKGLNQKLITWINHFSLSLHFCCVTLLPRPLFSGSNSALYFAFLHLICGHNPLLSPTAAFPPLYSPPLLSFSHCRPPSSSRHPF